jgi:hypothetical protein
VPAGADVPKRVKRPARAFDIEAARATVEAILAAPPANERVQRRAPDGQLVARWLLPLDMAPGVNSLNGRSGWQKGAARARCIKEMLRQVGGKRPAAPLSGRPHVRVIRFSSVEPDGDNAFSKLPLDALLIDRPKRPKGMHEVMWALVKPKLKPKKLCYLVDDSPKHIDLFVGWEPAPPGRGCVLVEVWTGRAT